MHHSRHRESSSSLLQWLRCRRRRVLFLILWLPVVVYVWWYRLKLPPRKLPVWSTVRVIRPNATQLTEYTRSNVGLFILLDLAKHQPNTKESLANCAEVSTNKLFTLRRFLSVPLLHSMGQIIRLFIKTVTILFKVV